MLEESLLRYFQIKNCSDLTSQAAVIVQIFQLLMQVISKFPFVHLIPDTISECAIRLSGSFCFIFHPPLPAVA